MALFSKGYCTISGTATQTPCARSLNLEAARLLASIRAHLDLVTVLGNLGWSEDADAVAFLAQAFWLAIRVQVPIEQVALLADALVGKLRPEHDAAPLIATTALFLVQTRGGGHPKQEEIGQYALALMAACAEARNVAPERFMDWVVGEGLNDPARFLPALDRALEDLVGPHWLFERGQIDL